MALNRFKQVKVKAIQCVVPSHCVDIASETEFYQADERKLARYKKILGLGTRYVLGENETNGDLAKEALRLLIKNENLDPKSVDTLIDTTSTHDYIGTPDACILQDEFGFSEDTACFDTTGLGCTDAIYAIWLAHSLIASGASKRCIVLESSASSKFCHPKNYNTKILFGDGAAAILLERDESIDDAFFYLRSLGKGWKNIVIPAGGMRFPLAEDLKDHLVKDKMGNPTFLYENILKGGNVFEFAMDEGPASVQKLMEFSKLSFDDVDFFALHQANAQIVRVVLSRAGIPKEKGSATTFSKYANCSGTSVLLNLCDERATVENHYVGAVTFGVGLSVASCLLDLSKCSLYPIAQMPKDFKGPSREEQIEYWTKFVEQ